MTATRHIHAPCQLPPGGNVCPARYLCIKYLISSPKFILTLGSPPSRPLDRKPSLQGTLYKPNYENSTTQNVILTTSNHHPCHRHKLGAKDGPNSETRREGTPNCLVWGQKQARVGNGQKRCLARARRTNAPPRPCPQPHAPTHTQGSHTGPGLAQRPLPHGPYHSPAWPLLLGHGGGIFNFTKTSSDCPVMVRLVGQGRPAGDGMGWDGMGVSPPPVLT